MVRKLTEGELEFVAQSTDVVDDVKVVRRTRPRRISIFASRTFWSWVAVVPAVVFSLGLWYMIVRVQSLMGPQVLDILAQREFTPEMRQTAERYGLGWLPGFLWWYRNRLTVLGSVWAVTALVILLIQFLPSPARRAVTDDDQVGEGGSR